MLKKIFHLVARFGLRFSFLSSPHATFDDYGSEVSLNKDEQLPNTL